MAVIVSFSWCYLWVATALSMAANSLASAVLGQNFQLSWLYAPILQSLGSAKTRIMYLVRRTSLGRWFCDHKWVFWTIVAVWTLFSTILKVALIASIVNFLRRPHL